MLVDQLRQLRNLEKEAKTVHFQIPSQSPFQQLQEKGFGSSYVPLFPVVPKTDAYLRLR